MRRIALVLIAGVALASCGRSVAGSGNAAATTAATQSNAPSPSPSPAFAPAANSTGGRVVRLIPGGVVIESVGQESIVDLTQAADVWRETSVPAGEIAIGDDLFINGTAGSPFVARYVWANIGRVDGVIKAIDNAGMDIEQQLRAGGTRMARIDFSAYVEFGAPGVNTTRADLVVGRTIGMVVYGPPTGPIRATRVWLW
jgi:hypothetical protein